MPRRLAKAPVEGWRRISAEPLEARGKRPDASQEGRFKVERESRTVAWSRQEQATSPASRSWQFQILACTKVQIPQKASGRTRGGVHNVICTYAIPADPGPPLAVSGHCPPGTAARTAAGQPAGLYIQCRHRGIMADPTSLGMVLMLSARHS